MKNISMENSVVLWVKPDNVITEYWDWKKYHLYSIDYYKIRVGLLMQSWGENTLDVWDFQKGLLSVTYLLCLLNILFLTHLTHEKISGQNFSFLLA